ncbi:hypothetical protein T02_9360 [Trichinella nativa]|uniref:Uncharacterized protein n=1 Tax=Trichinella nativa TaxID=6335 RepID=A0A0V1KQ54_9BILA|nr:hypothetical protein T06_15169 [Trichinella sp. T6]KRZ49238.1 hypothetical protein T02_9360 [Trichinella nativa]KRZ87674.1 hypothetical protein T08_4068 [Trichinella sp. T8]
MSNSLWELVQSELVSQTNFNTEKARLEVFTQNDVSKRIPKMSQAIFGQCTSDKDRLTLSLYGDSGGGGLSIKAKKMKY